MPTPASSCIYSSPYSLNPSCQFNYTCDPASTYQNFLPQIFQNCSYIVCFWGYCYSFIDASLHTCVYTCCSSQNCSNDYSTYRGCAECQIAAPPAISQNTTTSGTNSQGTTSTPINMQSLITGVAGGIGFAIVLIIIICKREQIKKCCNQIDEGGEEG